ncbi:MAG: hypothetical protein ABI776_03220 [Nocardioidaceae bacterium]
MLRLPVRRPLLAGMVGVGFLGVAVLGLGLEPRVVPMMVLAILAGAGTEVFDIGWSLALQENVEESKLSRVYFNDRLGSFVAIPLGQIAYGPRGETFGYSDVLVVSGVVYLAVVAPVLTSRPVRTLTRTPVRSTARSGR